MHTHITAAFHLPASSFTPPQVHFIISVLIYDLKKLKWGLGLWLRACFCAHVFLSELDISLKKMLD